MPLDVPWQTSHHGYITAAAAALAQAGITVTEVDLLEDLWDCGDPFRGGHLQVARPVTREVYGARDVRLMWNEECGWTLAAGTPGALADDLTHPLCDEVLPAPAALVAAVRGALVEQPQPTGRSHPIYRKTTDYSDEFENQLDTYLDAARS